MLRTLWFSFPINLLEYVRHLMASQLNMWNLRKTTTDAHKTVNLQKWDNNDKMATTLAKVQLHEKKCNYVGKNSTPSSKMQIYCPKMQQHGQDALGQAITRMGHLGRCTVKKVQSGYFACSRIFQYCS